MTIAPSVKGWCPGAYRPMMSGDGLVVRVRPRLARLGRDQVLGLCAVAQEFGNGVLDLTNRANLQIRGVREEDHEAVLEALNALGLLDVDPALEGRRNILMTPFWRAGNLSQDLATELMSRLWELPELPAKFGFAIDTAPVPVLRNDPADIRLERLADGQIILLADGAGTGRVVDQDAAIDAVIELARWFAASTRTGVRRMHRLLDLIDLPSAYLGTAPAPVAAHPDPGPLADGYFLGAPFGQMDAAALTQLMTDTGATALRVTPWRMFWLEGATPVPTTDFITAAGDPLLHANACAGAPGCSSASVSTRDLARLLAPNVAGSLHVSGCSKGCAHSRPAALTLVGRDGRFDLVRNGHAWDEPDQKGLSPEQLLSGTQ